jgi:hypothetical protein
MSGRGVELSPHAAAFPFRWPAYGTVRHPFLGPFNLIIFLCALLFGLRGGLASGIAASGITTFLAMHYPSGLGMDLRDRISYLLISGAFTGYLSTGTQTWFVRHREGLDRQHASHADAGRASPFIRQAARRL